METFRCVVAVPTRKIFDQDVYYANVPSSEGKYGVLPGHELMISINGCTGICTVNLDKDGKEQENFLIHDGATQMYNGILTVLAEFGKNVKYINLEKTQQKKAELEQRIAELETQGQSNQGASELVTSRRKLEWYDIQIKYAKENM
jgi:F-type H+-transporting ATPase subunit epsilon